MKTMALEAEHKRLGGAPSGLPQVSGPLTAEPVRLASRAGCADVTFKEKGDPVTQRRVQCAAQGPTVQSERGPLRKNECSSHGTRMGC